MLLVTVAIVAIIQSLNNDQKEIKSLKHYFVSCVAKRKEITS